MALTPGRCSSHHYLWRGATLLLLNLAFCTMNSKIMNLDLLYSELTLKTKAKLALIVLDGLGDVATREQGYLTPLEAAATPNLDALAKDSAHGRMIPTAPGITPGTGPVHRASFGYDPLGCQV